MENYLTKRETFDKVKNHLLTQRQRSSIKLTHPFITERCVYRHPEGLMCAVGCLIKDEAYSDDLESQVVRTLDVINALRKSNIDTSDESLLLMLQSLQNIHDGEPEWDWSSKIDQLEKICFPDASVVPEIALDAD